MKIIKVNGKEYTLEFSFAAAEHRSLVQKMFNVLSGSYLVKHTGMGEEEDKTAVAAGMIDGVSEMVSEIPHICITAFYAGLLENNPLTEDEAKQAMKAYMKENKLSFNKLYEELKQCMEDDGFFDLSGLTEMMENMNKSMEEKKALPKVPQDHKKKSTSTK